MKTSMIFCISAVSAAVTVASQAQTATVPAPTPYRIVHRESNERIWERTSYIVSPSGQVVPRQERYHELASGLCYQKDGQWQDSQEQINILPDGTASATAGQHQAYFPSDIYDGEITVVTSDGLQLKSRPAGLSYDDGTNTVLVAELTHSVGQLISSNQVIYTNALVGIGVNADLLYTYRKGGFEQFVILHEQPPKPEQFGLDPSHCRLQVLTEFFDPPAPVQTAMPANLQDELQDTTLDFGKMRMVQGKAFLMASTKSVDKSGRTPVYKSWVTLGGRTFLIEQLPYKRIRPQLATLPLPVNAAGSMNSSGNILDKISSRRLLPPLRLVQAATNVVRLARAVLRQRPGVALDYDQNDSEQDDFTFESGTTYYLSDVCGFGDTTTFQGGTVIKFAEANMNISFLGGGLVIYGPVVCDTGPGNEAIFTMWDDDSVGDQISGSDGSPSMDIYAVTTYIDFEETPPLLQYLVMNYAGTGIFNDMAGTDTQVSDSQFNQCCSSIFSNGGTILDGVSFNQSLSISYISSAFQTTFSQCTNILTGGSPSPAVYQDCEFYNDSVAFDSPSYLFNDLFDSCEVDVSASSGITNNLFYSSTVYFSPTNSVFDNDFDSSELNNTNVTTNGYNAYLNCNARLYPTNSHDIVSASGLAYESSFLGYFYQPSSSPLIGKGSTTANQIGLYHYTVLTNQAIEADNTVSIGYHYVATDTNGVPLDSNGDGIPDYIEDPFGNGLPYDGTNWALAILTQPVSQIAVPGTNVVFYFGADGAAPLSFRWYFNGTNIARATNSTLTLTNAQAINEGLYFAVVSNFSGSLTSSVVALEPSGLIGWWPGESNALDSAGPNDGDLTNGVSFTNGIVGQAFKFDGTNGYILVPDSPILKPTNLTIEAWVRFKSLTSKPLGNGTYAPVPDLEVIAEKPDVVPTGPGNGFYNDGYVLFKQRESGNHDRFLFGVTDSGGVTEAYATNTAVSIQTNIWYFVAAVRGSNYVQVFVNGQASPKGRVDFDQSYGTAPLYFGSLGEPAVSDQRLEGNLDEIALYNRALSSNEIQETYNAELSGIRNCFVPPVIVTQPSSQLVTVGTTATLLVAAAGSPPLSYQWSFYGTNIPGATNSTLILPNVQGTNTGNYSVVVSNNLGTVTSSNAFLTAETCFSSLDVAMVIDTSCYMGNPLADGNIELTAAQIAVTNFFQVLNFTNDQAALYSFNFSVTTNQTLTGSLPDLLSSLSSLTNVILTFPFMGNALQIAQSELASPRHNPEAMPVMVFLAGEPPADIDVGTNFVATSNLVLEAATLVKAAGTRLITIALSTNADSNFMALMASSPSDTYYATNLSQLTNAFNSIATSICLGTNTPPTNTLSVQIDYPINQTFFTDTNPTIQASTSTLLQATNLVEILASRNGGPQSVVGFAFLSTNGTYQVDWPLWTNGTYVLTAEIVDTNGPIAVSAPVTNLVLDIPSVAWVGPTNQETFHGTPTTNLMLEVTAIPDPSTIITNVVFYFGINGEPATNYIGHTTNGIMDVYSVPWTATNGTYNLIGEAFDTNGGIGWSATIDVTVVTNRAPTVYAPNVTNNLSANVVDIDGVVADDGLLYATPAISWTNISGPAPVTFTVSNLATASVSFSQPGIYQFVLSAFDGQWKNYSTNTVDITSPDWLSVNAGPTQRLVLPALQGTNLISTIDLDVLTQVTTGSLGGGIDYFAPSNCAVFAVYSPPPNWPQNSITFDLLYADGTISSFFSVSNVIVGFENDNAEEDYMATARSTLGGFGVGDMFFGNALNTDCEIVRVNPDRSVVGTLGVYSNAWVVLTNEPGTVSGVYVDQTGIWGGDLLVLTSQGGVWRINSAGVAVNVAETGDQDAEGIISIPNNPEEFGPFAGKVLIGGDVPPVYVVDTNGYVTTYDLGGISAENIHVIPPNENLFCVVDNDNHIYGKSAQYLQGTVGDLLVANENGIGRGYLYRAHWNGSSFDIYQFNNLKESWAAVSFNPEPALNFSTNFVSLQGVVTDNFSIYPSVASVWTQVSGGGTVTFGDPAVTNTYAVFSAPGIYDLRLTANDGQFTNYDDTYIDVLRNQAPSANAGPNQIISTNTTTLYGSVSDDGLPRGETNILWSVMTGPEQGVTFQPPNQAQTFVTFPEAGTYVLLLTVDDSSATNYSEVTVSVETPSLIVSPTNSWPVLTNNPCKVTAQLVDQSGKPMTNVPVAFNFVNNSANFQSANQYDVSGVTNNTDVYGFAYFTYTNANQNIGSDTILATAGDATPGIAIINWAQALPCDTELSHTANYGCFSMDWPTNDPHYADYYYLTGTTGSPIALTCVRTDYNNQNTYKPRSEVLILRDPSNSVVATSYNREIEYTPLVSGNYLLEVAELPDNTPNTPTPSYTVSLSCDGGVAQTLPPTVELLYNGANVLSDALEGLSIYGPVIFPPALANLATNITLTFSNSGPSQITISAFSIQDDYIDGNPDSQSADFTTNNCIVGTVLGPGASTNLSVTFLSTTNAFVNGDFQFGVEGNNGASGYDVQLVGDACSNGITALPQIQITAPPNGAQFYFSDAEDNRPITVTADAAVVSGSSGLGIMQWFFSGEEQNLTTMTPPFTDFANEFALNGPGTYVLNALAVDKDGGMAQATPVTIYAVGTPPQMQVLYDGTNVPNGGTIVLPATVTNVPSIATLVISNPTPVALLINDVETNSEFTNGDFSLLNDVSGSTTYYGGTTNLCVCFNALTNGTFAGALAIGIPTGYSVFDSYVVYIVGSAFPTGAAPNIQIVNPTQYEPFYAPAAISITAYATNGASPVRYVDFQELNTNGNIDLGQGTSIGGGDYTIMTPPLPAGTYTFTATAVDSVGRSATTQVTVQVNVGGPPITTNALYTVLSGSQNNTFFVLTNDYSPSGYPLTITGLQLEPNYRHGTISIVYGGTAISYTPVPATHGYPADGFTYFVSDGHGGTAKGGVEVDVFASALPSVSITNPPSPSSATAGTTVPLIAYVTPSQYITNVTFYCGQTPIGTAANSTTGSYTDNWTAVYNPSSDEFTAEAMDSFGQINTSAAIQINVNQPTNAVPVAALVSYAGLNDTNNTGTLIQVNGDAAANVNAGIFNISGQAYSPHGDPVTWQLGLYSSDGSTLIRNLTPQPQANGFCTTAVGSSTSTGNLALCDLTTLQNGPYRLELRVISDYIETDTSAEIILNSQLKIGAFSFSQQDLVIPVNGIPLTVTRTYNSINPDEGAFGYGWTYTLSDMDVSLDETRQPKQDAHGNTFSARSGGGRDITLTLPNGQRTTFYYDPVYAPSGFVYLPHWETAPGMPGSLKLTPGPNSAQDEIILFALEESYGGEPFWEDDANGSDVPDEVYDFPDFTLATPDGTTYILERPTLGKHTMPGGASGDGYVDQAWGTPYLAQIKERNGTVININSNSITASSPGGATNQITFQRNSLGLISSISDPNAITSGGPPAVKYEYDANGNLIYVERLVNRSGSGTYVTNYFFYTNSVAPHYITSILNGDGTQVAQNYYDDSGKLTKTVDASGNTTYFNNNLTNNSESVVDRLGNTNTYAYDTRGNVIVGTDPLGETTTNAYDANNNLTQTVDPLGHTNIYAYDGNNNRTMAVDALGHTNLYAYDYDGDLTNEIDPVGDTTANAYDGGGNLTNTKQFGPSGNLVTESSSSYLNGQLVSTANANGQTTATFGYDWSSGYMTNATDANGLTRAFGYDSDGNQTNSSYLWTPPGRGMPSLVTNETFYDGQNRVIMTIDQYGDTNQTFYDLNGKVSYTIDKFGNTNSFLYDARGNQIQATDARGNVTYTVYDLDSRPILTTDPNGITGTLTQYDAAGRTTNVVRLENVQVNLAPDTNAPGQMTTVIANQGTGLSTNSTTYYPNGWVHSRTSPDGTTSYAYYGDGQTETLTDPLSNTTSYAYDAAGRQRQMQDALSHTTQFQYDAVGRQIKTIFDNSTSVSNVFNNVGQRVGAVDQVGSLTQYSYDLAGQLTNVIKPQVTGGSVPAWFYQYDTNGNLTVTTDPNGHCTTNFYDPHGNQIAQGLPMGQSSAPSQFNAYGQLWKQHDFMGQMVEHRYDNFGRETNKYYLAAGATSPSYAVSYGYNQLDQLTNVTQFYGTNASNGYEPLAYNRSGAPPVPMTARLIASVNRYPQFYGSATALFMLCMSMAAIPAKKRRWLISAVGDEVTRLKSVMRSSTHGVERRRRIRMPSLFWRIVSPLALLALILSEPGYYQLCTAQAQCDIPNNFSTPTVRVTSFNYDVEGNLTQVNSPEGVINYGYDLATGRLIHLCTLNSEMAYGYDADGRLKTVEVIKRNGETLSPTETTTYSYDAVGNRSSVSLPNGLVTSYNYDDLNRLTNMVHQFGVTNLATYSYALDATGRRTNAVEALRQEDNTYQTNVLTWQYDAMYRLTNEICISMSVTTQYAYTNAYTYDSAGNRLQKTRTGSGAVTDRCLYNADDELTSDSANGGATDYFYDANGSLTNIATGATSISSYSYDLANKLNGVFAANGSQQAAYYYNDQGIRVELLENGITNHFLIDANNQTGYAQVLEELPSLGATPTMSYVIGDDVLGQSTGSSAPTVNYFLQDGHGNNRQLMGMNGLIADHYTYDAYGGVQSTISSSTAESAAQYSSGAPNITTKLYCGEQYDSVLQLYNLRSRYYDPLNGRFNQRDTFDGNDEDPQSLHKYLYSNCDPINGIDPSGQFTMIELMANIAIIATGFAFLSLAVSSAFQDATLKIQIIQTEQMLLSGAANLVGEAYNVAMTEAALLISQIQKVISAIQNAVNQAVKAGVKKTVDEIKKLPIFYVLRSLTPSIFGFTNWCLSMRPDWYVLLYNGPRNPLTLANRIWMWATYAEFWVATPPTFKVDEFPYATTVEGGPVGPAKVTYVPTFPIDENSSQGGDLSAFYRTKLGGKAGAFLVVPVPL